MLTQSAIQYGLSLDQIHTVHREYISRLACVAMADLKLSESELDDLRQASTALGIGADELQSLMSQCAIKVNQMSYGERRELLTIDGLCGKSVCFTGELTCSLNGSVLSREQAERLAEEHGLRVVSSVTKKLDLLVVSDPMSQSGKAVKARKYGIRIMHEPVFWKSIGVTTD